MSVVFDASALIAFLRDEPGAEAVQTLLERNTSNYVHALNLCEVYYDFWRAAGEHAAESAVGDLLAIGIEERNGLDSEFWREVGRLKAVYRRVSFVAQRPLRRDSKVGRNTGTESAGASPFCACFSKDCCALTLANRLHASLASADRHELEPLGAVGQWNITFIR